MDLRLKDRLVNGAELKFFSGAVQKQQLSLPTLYDDYVTSKQVLP